MDTEKNNFMDSKDFIFDSSDQIQVQLQKEVLESKSQAKTKSKQIKKARKTVKDRRILGQGEKKEYEQNIGRPTNLQVENNHLLVSKSFNNIIYHYCRFLIFLKLKQGIEIQNHTFSLTEQQNFWLSQTEKLMNLQNFSDYGQEKPVFLLHPNSLHFVFQQRKQSKTKYQYTKQELKFNFYALLKKKRMLTEKIFRYVDSYWHDIICLVDNPGGESQSEIHNEIQKPFQLLSNQQPLLSNRPNTKILAKNKIESQKYTKRPLKRQNREDSQLEFMKRELLKDDSIAAYEIACYLHSCFQNFELKIVNN